MFATYQICSNTKLLFNVEPDNEEEGRTQKSLGSQSVIALDSKCNRTTVDIFVKASNAIVIENVAANDFVLLTGVRCTEETYTDETHGLRTSSFRLVIPDETTVACRVLPQCHGSVKQVSSDLGFSFREASSITHKKKLQSLAVK